jgi:hypothetical protein
LIGAPPRWTRKRVWFDYHVHLNAFLNKVSHMKNPQACLFIRVAIVSTLLGSVGYSRTALAEDTSALATAIANAQTSPPGGEANVATKDEIESVLSPALRKTKSGLRVSWSRAVGESGAETCQSQFTLGGVLVMLECNLEYVSHSMGPENSRQNTSVKRFYDAKGTLTKVQGRFTKKRLLDGKQIENRKIVTAEDEKLIDLSKPLLKVDLAIAQTK